MEKTRQEKEKKRKKKEIEIDPHLSTNISNKGKWEQAQHYH